MTDVTSRHLRGAAEVILMIPIKPGFAEIDEQIVAYSTRLRNLLNGLFDLRRVAVENDLRQTAGPVERLRTVFNAQWTVLEEPQELLITASFDRTWEGYFRLLADETGALLDVIFSHCVGFGGHSTSDGFDKFIEWIREHQKPCNFFYSAAPSLTTDDLRYLSELAPLAHDPAVAAVVVGPPKHDRAAPRQIQGALTGMYGLRKWFPLAESVGQRNAQDIFDDAMGMLFYTEAAELEAIAAKLPDPLKSWIIELPKRETARIERLRPRAAKVTLSEKAIQAIQGGILTSYPQTTHGVIVLLGCVGTEAWASLLQHMSGVVTSHALNNDSNASSKRLWTNFALTFAGLRSMGLAAETLAEFPKEFREGMAERAGLLGDVGNRVEDTWLARNWPDTALGSAEASEKIPVSTVDAVVILQGAYPDSTKDLAWWARGTDEDKKGEKHALRQAVEDLSQIAPGVHVLHVQALQRQFDGSVVKEHFGYQEGASQPVANIEYPSPMADVAQTDLVNLGELLLGYENKRGERTKCPYGKLDLFANGSFLVVRKLQQHVSEFYAFVKAGAEQLKLENEDLFKGLIAGRMPDGQSLVKPTTGKPANEFDYQEEPGKACPLFAHARRTNPRFPDARTPRILRRGMSYGPAYSEASSQEERGLLFMAYNASIAEQFEVLQGWINGGNSTGLLSANKDILVGQAPVSPLPYWLQLPNENGAQTLAPPKVPFVSLRWGLYLFVPAITAIDALANSLPVQSTAAQTQQSRSLAPIKSETPAVMALAERGKQIISGLVALAKTDEDAARARAKDAWKKVLEELSSAESAAAVWAAVHHHYKGILETPYGVLVANLELAKLVLTDDGRQFSVKEYDRRLKATVGPHYLGLDRQDPKYDQLSNLPNQYIRKNLSGARGYIAAHACAEKVLVDRQSIDVRELGMLVVGQLCGAWLGMPASALESLVFTSRYAFQVNPGKALSDKVPGALASIQQTYEEGWAGPMTVELRSQGYPAAEVNHAAAGAVVGFAAPAIAAIASVLDRFIETEELWRLAAAVKSVRDGETVEKLLRPPLLAALNARPIPSLLYRTARAGTKLGPITFEKECLVIVGLGVLYQEAKTAPTPEVWLFGGEHAGPPQGSAGSPRQYTDNRTSHGCPAREAALGVMMGTIAALLTQRNLKRAARFTLTFDAPGPQSSPATAQR